MRYLFLFVVLTLAGCAAIDRSEERGIEYRLKLAGFKVVPANPEQLSRMTPYKMEGRVKNGRALYRYADPAKGRFYEGGRREYERYRKIAVDTQIRRVGNLNQIGPRRPTGPLVW